jgi:hypothetical protein
LVRTGEQRGRERAGAALIEGPFGTPGDFELATLLADGGMAHYRRNPAAGFGWSKTTSFGSGIINSLSLCQAATGGAAGRLQPGALLTRIHRVAAMERPVQDLAVAQCPAASSPR